MVPHHAWFLVTTSYGNTVGSVMKKASDRSEADRRLRSSPSGRVVEFDSQWNVLSIEEKPNNQKHARSPGVYYDSRTNSGKTGQPSQRGELEIITQDVRNRKEMGVFGHFAAGCKSSHRRTTRDHLYKSMDLPWSLGICQKTGIISTNRSLKTGPQIRFS